jgi:murein DD-endopeptidase MepM/ murein hydrolase activator NlpD
MRIRVLVVASLVVASLVVAAPARAAAGTWPWPVTGPVIRAFDPPDSPFGAGHRGIDIATPVGSVVLAPADGRVAFAGQVGGRLFLTIDHSGGLESTYSWVASLDVREGDFVQRGQPVAKSGAGHTGDPVSNLHLGVKLHDVYVDPLDYLEPVDIAGWLRLAPVLGWSQ